MKLVTEDRPGMVADVTQAIAGVGTNIRDIRASLDERGRGQLVLTAEIFDMQYLEKITGALKSVRGVMDVERITGEPCSGLNGLEPWTAILSSEIIRSFNRANYS